MGTFSKSLAAVRRLRRRAGRGDRVPAHLLAPVPVHRLGRPGGARRGARGAAHHPLRRGPGAARGGARARTLPRRGAAARSATARSPASPCAQAPAPDAPSATIATPIVPVLVGDDWKAALLWRALYDGGVFTNCALHPAVPPGGALLRTSVMATHDRATLDRALEVFARVKLEFEAEHGPLPAPASTDRALATARPPARLVQSRPCVLSKSSQVRSRPKKVASSV